MPLDEERERIRAEAQSIRRAALLAAERHYAAESPWYHMVYWLGIPATVLAALSGAAAFANLAGGVVAGVISIIVAILTSLMTFLNPSTKGDAHHNATKGYEALYHSAGIFYRVESLSSTVDPSKQLDLLMTLSTTFNDLNKTCPVMSGWGLRRAGEAIKSGVGEVVRDPDDPAMSAQ